MVNDEIAEVFGVNRDTIYEWMGQLQDFSDAIKRGRDQATDMVVAAHLKSAVGFTAPETKVFYDAKLGRTVSERLIKFYPPDVRAQINWLRNAKPEEWGRGDMTQASPPTAPADDGSKSFEEFCAASGYPAPFAKQCEMRTFVFEPDELTARLMLGSRGYGKTDYVTILGVGYQIYRSRQFRCLILTKSDDKNKSIIDEISKALRANGVDLEKDNALNIRVKGLHGKDPSVAALTVNSNQLRGRHPDLVLMDDPVTEDDVSEATRDKLQRKYNELTKLCQNVAIIGQPVHPFDLYETLRPIIRTLNVPHGTIPELDHDLVAMRLAGVSETSINASYHLKVTSETGNPFSKVSYLDDFQHGDCVAFIDPSHKGGDYTAMSVGRAHFDGVAIKGFCWKMSWDDCIPDIIAAIRELGIRRLAFECNGLGTMPLAVLRSAINDAHLDCGVVGVDSTTYKHSRIMAAGTFAKSIFIAKTSHSIYISQVTKYEYKSKYDDGPDSLASLLQWIGLIRGKQ